MNEMTQRRLRLGMVGGGRGGFIGGVHRIAARIDDRYELVAGALSTDWDRNQASAADLHISPERVYRTFNDMAQKEASRADGIDVVAIVTPNHVHYAAARAFLDAGIHVICDKPLTNDLESAQSLARQAEERDLIFVVTHNYTGYPLVRQARHMATTGDLGAIRLVQVEYPQGWLTTKIEDQGQKQAQWRTDPDRSGPAGCLGDIGSHAFNLACFVSGLEVSELAADLHTFVEGRLVDDNCNILLRFNGGARGMLWASQVAPGNENGLKIRIYGEKGGLSWEQEDPNRLVWTPLDQERRILTRGGPGLCTAAERASRTPAGHPEGYLEGFAQIYRDAAELITARLEKRTPDPTAQLAPTVRDGLLGVRFIERCLASSRKNAAWVRF